MGNRIKKVLIFSLVFFVFVGCIGQTPEEKEYDSTTKGEKVIYDSEAKAYGAEIDEIKREAMQFLDGHAREFAALSDAIWSYAELGFQEYRSSNLLAYALKRQGFKVELGVAGIPTAITASWGSGKPVIGITGEYDALPSLSQMSVSHKEPVVEGAPGHGCGHNVLGTTGVASAIALKHVMELYDLKGTVRFFGCPAEESGSAKIFMVRKGMLDDVDVVLDNHPSNGFSVDYGVNSNALFCVRVTYYGKAAHAAGAPWMGVSALDAVELMTEGINLLREHLRVTHRIHYVILEGGAWPNIVPDKSVVMCYVRDTDERIKDTYQKVLNCVEAGAIGTGCEYEVELIKAYHQKHSNEVLARVIHENMKLVGLPKWTKEEQDFAKRIQKNMELEPKGLPKEIRLMEPQEIFTGGGSTDVGEISLVAPVATVRTPCWALGVPGHSWGIVATGATDIAHKGLLAGAKTITCTSIDLLTKPEELRKIKDEFEEMSDGYPYECYMPKDAKPALDLFEEEMKRWRPLMEEYYKEG